MQRTPLKAWIHVDHTNRPIHRESPGRVS